MIKCQNPGCGLFNDDETTYCIYCGVKITTDRGIINNVSNLSNVSIPDESEDVAYDGNLLYYAGGLTGGILAYILGDLSFYFVYADTGAFHSSGGLAAAIYGVILGVIIGGSIGHICAGILKWRSLVKMLIVMVVIMVFIALIILVGLTFFM